MTEIIFSLSSSATKPSKGSENAAGYDLYASEDVVIPSWGKQLVGTGVRVCIVSDKPLYLRIASRSGLSVKSDIEVGAGVVDYDYRGEVKVVLRNFSDNDFSVHKGDRIAQMIPTFYNNFDSEITVDENTFNQLTTERGDGGFGSTGI